MTGRRIEKLIVLVIFLGLLKLGYDTIGDSLGSLSDLAKARTATTQIHNFDLIFSSFYAEYSRYPENSNEFYDWLQRHFSSTSITSAALDPWGNSYWFLHREWVVRSAGPDSRYRNSDDLARRYPYGYQPARLNGGRGVWLRSQTKKLRR